MTLTCGFLEIYSHFLLYHFTEPLNLSRNGARQLMAHSSAFSFSYDLLGTIYYYGFMFSDKSESSCIHNVCGVGVGGTDAEPTASSTLSATERD